MYCVVRRLRVKTEGEMNWSEIIYESETDHGEDRERQCQYFQDYEDGK